MGSRVFVGGLTYRVRERDLERFFRKYGKIREISMKNGFAFVEFDDHRDADDAIYELNGRELLGERVSVERARGIPKGSDLWRGGGGRPPRSRESDMRSRDRYGPPTRTEYRLIVENLSSRVSWQVRLLLLLLFLILQKVELNGKCAEKHLILKINFCFADLH